MHYEARLQADLEAIRVQIGKIAGEVGENLESAGRAFLDHDRRLAAETILADLSVNRRIRKLDADCHAFVARHWPAAAHLRLVSSVLRLSVALERMGDYAVSICREAVQLSEPCDTIFAEEMDWLLQDSIQLLQEAIQAFLEVDDEAARSIIERAAAMEDRFSRTYSDLAQLGEGELPVVDLMAMLVVLNRISRLRAQVKNVGEEVVFVKTGEVKGPKVYEVLFVDRRNDFLGPLVQACALKSFPGSGHYATAGVEPAGQLSGELEQLALKNALTLGTAGPRSLQEIPDLSVFHVVVVLEPVSAKTLEPPPFRTVRLDWELNWDEEPPELLTRISGRLNQLMVTLRGERAT